jgi:hypothetical protein
MVAVQSANRAPDAALASELGSLLFAHTRIRDPRWRLDAVVRRVPALVRFGVSLDSTRAAIRALGARASCPEPLRAVLLELVERHFDAALVRTLWLPDWRSCAQAAVDAAVRLRDEDGARRIVEIVVRSRHARYATPVIARRPTLADLIALVDDDGRAPYVHGAIERVEGRVDGRVDGRGDSRVDARVDGRVDARVDGRVDARVDCRVDARVDGRVDARVDGRVDARVDGRVDARVDARVDDLVEAAERIARGLPSRDQPYARAHLARFAVRHARACDVVRIASQPSPFRETSIRAGATLLLVRELVARALFVEACALADTIERALIRELAYVEIAEGIAWSVSAPVDADSTRPSTRPASEIAPTIGHRRDAHRRSIVSALRLLNAVTRPELVAERDLLRAEIGLMVRRDHERVRRRPDVPGWQLPAWLRQRDWLDGETRAQRHIALVILRLGLRTRDTHDIALVRDDLRFFPPAALLAILPRIGVDIDAAIAALARLEDSKLDEHRSDRSVRRALARDALFAEHVAMRATALARTTRELPESMRLGLAGLPAFDNADGRSLERALFDEGVALSSSAPRRRRVLIGVAQSALRNARSQDPEVLRARLRTLVHLGGALGADALAKSLAQLPIDATWLATLEALCALDAPRAADLVIERIVDVRRAGVQPADALGPIVISGGMSRARAIGLAGAVRMLDAALGERAQHWLDDFTRRWRARTSSPLDETALAWLRTCDLSRDPQALLAELEEHRASVLAGDAREIADRLATDPRLLRALLLDPPRVDRRMKPWSLEQWKSLLARAASRNYAIDVEVVRRCSQLLRKSRDVHALIAGDLGALGVPSLVDVQCSGERYRIRVLDKRRDLLTYLRFADTPVRSCYRSDSGLYRADDLAAVWRDPLSVCVHVERANAPCGFVFGSFAHVEGKPALVLNSLHVRPNAPAVRESILRALERAVCAPLGIRVLGIANWHNGEGHLPDDYVFGERSGTRLCGLTNPPSFDDDIYADLNTQQSFDLYWRDLDR